MSQRRKILLTVTLLFLFSFSGSLFFFNLQKIKKTGKEKEALRESLAQKAEELKSKEKEREKTEEEKAVGFCGNDYLPLVPGANWRFDLKEDGTSDVIEVNAIESEKGKQVLTYHFKERDWTNKTTFLCLPSGIKTDNLNFFLGTERSYILTTPLSARGSIFPNNFNENYLWQFQLKTQNESVSKNNYQDIDRRFNEDLNLELELKNPEPVETPAGILEAKKIEFVFLIEEKNPLFEEWTPYEGAGSMAEETDSPKEDSAVFSSRKRQLKCSIWLVSRIGIVKSVCQEEGREPIILNLRSFQIPAIKN
jgi:hypothetical protein